MARSDGDEAGHGDPEDEPEPPEEFLDPISMQCMRDPVLLCGSGQIYCLGSLRLWLASGQRRCPRSNLTLRDVQVVRLPTVRSRIAAWREAAALPPLPPLDPPAAVLQEAGEEVPAIVADLRCGDVHKRGLAAGRLNNLLIGWGREEPRPEREQVCEAVLLDLVWLLRQGDPFGSGVAAAALAQYRSPQQRAFLAAVAAWPAVALLWSPHEYGQHGAARLLASLARAHASVPALLVEAGAVGGLLAQLEVDEAGRFDYARCSAAALAALCQCKAAREEVQRRGGVRRLKQLVLQPEPAAAHGPGVHLAVRCDRRDAAHCLLALGLTEAEAAAAAPAVEFAALRRFAHCSYAWVLGDAPEPTAGYTEAEREEGLPQLAAGEGGGGA